MGNKEIMIEKYRVDCLCLQIEDMVKSGIINKVVAKSLLGNLADTNKEEATTILEQTVFSSMDRIDKA